VAIDPRKTQKKLAKQKAKRKAKALDHRRSQQGKTSPYVPMEFELGARGPILECLMTEEIFDSGMGQVIVSRTTGSGVVAAGIFLLDVFCLGVKDAFPMLQPRATYENLVRQTDHQSPLVQIEPACARKLVEDAVVYARDLGFEPHDNYRVARKVLQDIDATVCEELFTFGKDGKPFFISGPNDSEQRSRQIIETLERRCGADGYHHLVGLNPDMELIGDYDDSDEDFDDDDNDDDDVIDIVAENKS
jgi:hypothetical protein